MSMWLCKLVNGNSSGAIVRLHSLFVSVQLRFIILHSHFFCFVLFSNLYSQHETLKSLFLIWSCTEQQGEMGQLFPMVLYYNQPLEDVGSKHMTCRERSAQSDVVLRKHICQNSKHLLFCIARWLAVVVVFLKCALHINWSWLVTKPQTCPITVRSTAANNDKHRSSVPMTTLQTKSLRIYWIHHLKRNTPPASSTNLVFHNWATPANLHFIRLIACQCKRLLLPACPHACQVSLPCSD